MSLLLMFIIGYSLRLNSEYSRVLINFTNYNAVYDILNVQTKELFFNISEQKPYDKTKHYKFIEKINKSVDAINYDKNNLEISSKIEIIRRTTKSIKIYVDVLDTLIQSGASFDKRKTKLDELIKITTLIKDDLQELMALDLNYSQNYIESIQNGFRNTLIIIISAFIITIIACIVFLLRFTKKIVSKIIKIADNANKLASGELNLDEIIFNTNDEFKILATSFNTMKNNVKNYIYQISYNEKRISSILDGMYDCVVIVDMQGIIESCNYATKTLFNYLPDELIGQSIVKLLPELDINKEYDDSQVIDGKLQLTGMKKNGKIFPVEVGFSEIKLEDKEICTLVIHDITEHKEVEKIKDEFISVVSHELRTPLTSIKGGLEFTLSGALGALPEKVVNLLTISHNNAIRLGSLINDILDISKISQGKVEFRFEKLSLAEVIEETINQSAAYAKNLNVTLKIKNPINKDIFINSDKNRLIQVLTNLISNAAKFSYENGDVDVYVEEKEDFAIVNVQDYGVGIPEDCKEKIFQKFFQVDSSATRAQGGTGLGLNITQMLVERMNGKISFISEKGKGS
ncbi:MAG: PAS domain-containing protein, partial [Candidatus Gastranaerophilales bacterium]|nr:PAS domain-containing protein [Candidatus Gastranaerophilales bacterium]